MKNPFSSTHTAAVPCLAALTLWIASSPAAYSQGASLLDDLVSYWPLDEIQGTKTPDIKSGYDFNLVNIGPTNVVSGKYGQAFRFNGSDTMLSRIHAPADQLPAVKHASFTISLWARVNGIGQNDKRLFSEGSAGSDPLFNLGTHNGGANGAVDVFIRQAGAPLIDHLHTFTRPFDGVAWRHILYWQEEKVDGSSTRRIYIDGLEDFLLIPDKVAGFNYTMDRTSIGAILRSTASAFVSGEIDDVAIWKRALTPAEITDLHANGMPDLSPPVEPLAVNSFSADYSHVVMGGKVRLRWDVTKDAVISLSPGIGDVTGISAFGVGSTEVTVATNQAYTLKISRGEEELERLINLNAVSGVSPGWHWVEDFESRNPGNLLNQPRWLVPDGSVEVREFAQTRVAGFTAGNDLAGLHLADLAIPRSTRRTLFFRFHQSNADADLPVNVLVGLTEKSLRSAGDLSSNAGTLIRFSRLAGSGNLVLQARDGQFSGYTDADYTFLPETPYNVWIDIQNNSFDSGLPDTYSVHVAPEGGARTTVFDEFLSDREPGEVPILGFPREDIDSLVLVAPGADQASQAILLDDFYMSDSNTWNATVPKTIPEPDLAPFMITTMSRNPNGTISLTWNSKAGTTYYIQTSTDMIAWPRLNETGVPSQGETTTTTVGPFGDARLFLRVER